VLIYTIAVMGTAKTHVKWQAANGVGYKYGATVTIDENKCKHCMKCLSDCPKDVFSGDAKRSKVTRPRDCTLCRACEKFCEPKAISVAEDDKNFVFKFETDGSLSAETALKKAMSLISESAQTFGKMVEKL
jgi:DNA-directed RNA polymerase subunit D